MKVAHLAIARRIKDGKATVEDYAALDNDPDWEAAYAAVHKHADELQAAESAKEDGEARETLAGCFKMMAAILKQVEDNAVAQAESARAQAATAKALAEGLAHVEKLAAVLARPKTREGVVQLPDGKAVKMTIKETRQ